MCYASLHHIIHFHLSFAESRGKLHTHTISCICGNMLNEKFPRNIIKIGIIFFLRALNAILFHVRNGFLVELAVMGDLLTYLEVVLSILDSGLTLLAIAYHHWLVLLSRLLSTKWHVLHAFSLFYFNFFFRFPFLFHLPFTDFVAHFFLLPLAASNSILPLKLC